MKSVLIPLVLLFTFLSCSDQNTESPPQSWEGFTVDHRDEALLFLNEYLVFNNVTGKYDNYSGTYRQSIYKGEGSNTGSFGWEWSQQGEANTPFYPEVIYGWNPWRPESTTTALPRLWSREEQITLSFQREFQAQGRHNTALDIWLCSEAIPIDPSQENHNTVAELMIWLEHTETVGVPALAEVEIAGEAWELYIIEGIPSYIAFLSQSQEWTGSLEITPFLIYLEDHGLIPPGLYLSAIELGNEIWSGSGYMKLQDYSILISD